MAIHANKQQKPLTMALKFILKNRIMTKTVMRNEYLLDPKTLKKIEAGEPLKKKTVHDFYLAEFVRIIDDYRYSFSSDGNVPKIKDFLIDLFLASMGMKTQAERQKEAFMKQFNVDKVGANPHSIP
ncbi:MAG: hypothetical protein MJZ32_06120 [Bacteroidaceae bacterium]|nr:hypothetical protein [Bacteroidaceae bacterium]